MYLYEYRHYGLLYGPNDAHGVNQCYWYADANLGGESEDRRPRGCHLGMMNGACIEMHAKKQVSVQIATAASEIIEAANAALDAAACNSKFAV